MKFSFCVILLASAVLVTAQDNAKDEYENFEDDYDSFYDYDQMKEEGDKIEAELDKLNEENDLKVKEEIDNFQEKEEFDKDDILDGIDDYQFEDNRDKPKDTKESDIFVNDPIDAVNNNDKKKDDQADYALLWGDDSVAPLPVPDAEPVDDKEILEETQKILEDNADAFEEEINKALRNADAFPDNKPGEEIIDETKKILEETGDSFDDKIKTDDEAVGDTKKETKENDLTNNAEQLNNAEKLENIPNENMMKLDDVEQSKEIDDKEKENPIEHNVEGEGDTVDKAYADLNADLDKLLETLDKLSDDGSVSDEKLEEVFDKLDEHFFKEDDNNVEGSEELVEDDKNNLDDIDLDKVLEDILNEDDKKDDAASLDLNVLLNDEMNEPNPDDAFQIDVESLPDAHAEPILFPDAIVDKPKDTESIENNKSAEINASVESHQSNPEGSDKAGKDTVDINTLNSAELEELVDEFSKTHSEVKDVHSKSFIRDVAPIHMKLKVDTPIVIQSPNYPSGYPTNNVIDWVFEGEGVGIEMNITDLMVNGAMGDYLLVIPGGVDDSSTDGLLFTYRLNSEKRFVFWSVDRLFLRFFAARANFNINRGFQLSLKMMMPIPEEPEPLPEPEAVLPPPRALHTLYLATPVQRFIEVNETFRVLLADMAEAYIQDNSIERGPNTTAEATQITSVSPCPVTWPGYELCSAVTFGVSLVKEEEGEEQALLDEEALALIWNTYSTRDPFALQLRRLGITEFEPPSSAALTAWLVIAAGVVISMAMLAAVLWRFSCFEDYTRMKTFSETDSLANEKRGLDLYPTPHQTLPPLYAEADYKWTEGDDTTRVDMGGFANKSYARDMYDFDSDEEVVTPRDRNGAATGSELYSGSVA